MSYFLTDDQECDLNVFLDEENLKVCKTQLESKDVPDELKEIIKKTEEAGSPIPAFNPEYGYYSVSFTPCNEGNRIYAHHHLTNISKAIFDPSVSPFPKQGHYIHRYPPQLQSPSSSRLILRSLK